MLFLEFLDRKDVFVQQQVLANLRFSISGFLNFAKGMISSYYNSFVVVISLPLTSPDLDERPIQYYERKKQAMDSKCNSSMLEEGSY